jgi:hydroxyethylthiazole kinase
MINLGTPNLQRMQTISQIGKTAMRHHVPVVLDPVGCGTSAFRYQFIHEWLSEVNPTVIRGNFSEIAALSSPADSGNLHAGIDGANEDFAIASTIDIAKRTALMYNTIIVLSGVIDIITDGCTTFTVSNGCREMSRITGMGCMLSAYLAAIVSHSASRTPHDLAVAVATFGLSGEMASSYAGQEGLGTFHQSFWDKISNLSFDTLKGGLCIEHR